VKRALFIFLGFACFARADHQPWLNDDMNELYAESQQQADPSKRGEMKAIYDSFQKESDARAREKLRDQLFELVNRYGEESAMAAWRKETDPAKRAELGHQVIHYAAYLEQPELAEEILAGKPVTQAEISLPTNAVPLPLTILKEWDFSTSSSDEKPDVVIRRVGPLNFELWTPTEGWLFNEHGAVVNEAKVPRRDGTGREWHGAFLPSGEWITTDLWEGDDRLYLFSGKGTLVNSFPIGSIAGWARADLSGQRWVVSVAGGQDLRISPWGWRQQIDHWFRRCHLKPPASWAFVDKIKSATDYVESRDLGSRGFYLDSKAESCDQKSSIEVESAAHGMWVGLPTYSVSGPGESWRHTFPNGGGGNFGFFPFSSNVWIGDDKYPTRLNRADEHFRSWIIDAKGKAIGWLAAERLDDDPDGKRMWFVDEQGRLLKVSPDGVISEVLQPLLPGASGESAPFAHVLFPDLKLGFFYTKPGHLVLARWP
jgi:hypothetical protein